MIEFFDRTLGYLEQFWVVLKNVFESIFSALGYFNDSLFVVFDILGYLPVVIGSCALITLLFAALKFLIGR